MTALHSMFSRAAAQAGVLAAALALGACSGGDAHWADPTGWYDAIVGGGAEREGDPALAARAAAERAGPLPGADEPYPAVGSVAGTAPETTREEERARLRETLAAARDGEAAPAAAAEPPPVPPSATIAAPDAPPGEEVRVAVIHYPHGASGLAAEDRTVLRRVADSQRARGAAVRVVGHASGRPGAGGNARRAVANFRVALERARGVADELARFGVPADRILVESRSDAEPVFSNATPLGEAANRRVDIYFVTPFARR